MPEFCSVLLRRQVFSRLLSALPYYQHLALTNHIPTSPSDPSADHLNNSINTSQSLGLTTEEVLGILNVTAYVLQTLSLLLHLQKQFGLSLELLGNQLQSMLEYDRERIACFDIASVPETSPLLDTLKEIDQRFAEPANMPAYLNVCLVSNM